VNLPDLPPLLLGTIAAAVLLELCLYAWQQRLQVLPRIVLLCTALAPWLAYAVPAGIATPRDGLLLALLVALPLCWFRLLPTGRPTDIGFLLVAAAPLLFGFFKELYPRPHPELRLAVLGQMMWIRVVIAAAQTGRPTVGIGFGLWPRRADWLLGSLTALVAAPVLYVVADAVGFAAWRWPADPWWQVAGTAMATFFGVLWVVALGEEFLFRGLLQNWVAGWTGSTLAAIGIAALAFGFSHLGFGRFPNWPFVVVASVAGLFFGWASHRGGGIRPAMVAHAWIVMLWRTLFH
jgi:membrane protease YdiL (CAAX protease family)